jgi:DNA-binding response OmpR family regulator
MSSSQRHVLIADDSPVVRVTVARRVRAEGLAVIERDSVASARGIDPSTLSCALLDYDLGDGFGVSIAKDLRTTSEDLPIAFFTSTDTTEVVEAAKAFGPVFSKPDELDAAIEWVTRASKG